MQALFDNIIGHSHIINNIAIHNYDKMLFYGPFGVGKFLTAKSYADFFGKNKDSIFIFNTNNIADLRDIFNKISHNQKNILIIDNINTMNKNIQNAVINFLESKNENTKVIIVGYGYIDQTIRSRCLLINFHKLSQEETAKITDIAPENQFKKDLLETGSPGLIKLILQNKKINNITKIDRHILNIFNSLEQYDAVILEELFVIFAKKIIYFYKNNKAIQTIDECSELLYKRRKFELPVKYTAILISDKITKLINQ